MRLLVDCIPFDGGKSGISAYVRNVVRELAAAGHDLTLLTEPGVGAAFFPGFPVIEAPAWTRRAALSMLWHLFLLPRRLRRLRASFDGFVITAANRRVCRTYPLPTAGTVHDLANVHIKAKYSPLRLFYLARILPRYARRLTWPVAVSRATAADMAAHWRMPVRGTTVLYNGAVPLAPPRGSWLKDNNLKAGGYLLYVSRIEHPGKNHVTLIEAFEKLNRDLDLVLAGSAWKDADIVRARAAASPFAARIRLTGFLPDADLSEAYRGAAAYVFPSRYEGFGLSLVEAMAECVPCACSNNSSLGEIAGDVAETFDPEDADAMAAAIGRLLDEPPDARAARLARGRAHAATFSWKDHAAGLARLFTHPAPVSLFGIPVSPLTLGAAVERITELAKGPRDRAAFIATLNVDFVCNAVPWRRGSGDTELWDYLRAADLVTADGFPIVKLAGLKGTPLPGRVTGADLVPALAARFAREGLSIYVLGGDEPALGEALAILRRANPGLRVAGTDSARVSIEPGPANDAVIARINAARPDFLFVALGNPKQELWMGRFAARLRVPAMIGVGGTFNFIAGTVRRAPVWMQRGGLEWVWRIAQEPGRLWRRYAYGLVKFSWLAFVSLVRGSKDLSNQ